MDGPPACLTWDWLLNGRMTTRQRKPVSKALQALYWLVEMSQPEIGVRQLAAAMNIAPSSAHRVLATLADAGFVSRDIKSQRYALTPEFFRLSHRAVTMSPVRQIGLAALQRLAAVCRESVLLGLYDDIRQEMIFVARIDSASASSHAIPMNEWLPIRTGASGLAILAFLDEDTRHSVIERSGLHAPLARACAEPSHLESDLADVRHRGYAFTRCQLVPGATGLAAPIFNRRGQVIGDVCVTMPAQRSGENGRDRLIDEVRHCASDITARM